MPKKCRVLSFASPLAGAAGLLVAGAPSSAGISAFDLLAYQHTSSFALPEPGATEASAVAYNWDNGNLFVLGDEGDAIVEVTRTGAVVSQMTLTGFDDTEGLTYIGGGQFVIVEERLQDVYRLSYSAGGTADRSSLATSSVGPTVGNIGLEGASYERSSGDYFFVKEKTPQAAYQATIDFTVANVTPTSLFSPALGVSDLSDLFVLSNIAGLTGSGDEGNLLILSQESGMLLEVSRTGAILSSLSIAGLSGNAEGITMDDEGVIYVCDEGPNVYVFTQIPAPGGACVALLGLGAAARRRRR